MGQIAVEYGANLLPFAQAGQGPLRGDAVRAVHLGRVDPRKAEAHAGNVNGVAVDHPGAPPQFLHPDDLDCGRLPGGNCRRLARLTRYATGISGGFSLWTCHSPMEKLTP